MQALTSSQLSPVEKNAAAELLEKREKHWWGSKSPGWIDWANLGLGGEDMGDILNASSSIEGGGSNGAAVVKYLAPLEGGRTKPDGDLLRWRVIFPDSAVHGRGAVPFFCEDLTPRDRRVPLAPSGSDHPCKATGIAYISLCAPTASEFNKLSSQLSFVLGDSSNPRISPDGKEARWTLKTPQDTAPATHDEAVVVTKAQRLELVLRTATEPDRPISIEEGGEAWIDEVGFWVDGDSGGDFGHGEVASGGRETGFGKVAFVPLPQTKV
ncbi:hypothetical protein FRB90_010028 [Tulasnella sp. 427]|nr:hypothetical protein FRB90_010028 [Tulasnella sp. 427]